MDEREVAAAGNQVCNFYKENLAETAAYVENYCNKKLKVVKEYEKQLDDLQF